MITPKQVETIYDYQEKLTSIKEKDTLTEEQQTFTNLALKLCEMILIELRHPPQNNTTKTINIPQTIDLIKTMVENIIKQPTPDFSESP